MICEKCWREAYDGGYFGGCKSQTERYYQLLSEKEYCFGDEPKPEQGNK